MALPTLTRAGSILEALSAPPKSPAALQRRWQAGFDSSTLTIRSSRTTSPAPIR